MSNLAGNSDEINCHFITMVWQEHSSSVATIHYHHRMWMVPIFILFFEKSFPFLFKFIIFLTIKRNKAI